MKIRLATKKDLKTVNEIYNQSVPSKKSTAHLLPVSTEERTIWFNNHNENKYPVFIAEDAGKILGWISVSPYRTGRQALQYTAEVSYYIHKDYQHAGIATFLMTHVINNCEKFNIKNLIAILMEHNTYSIKLLEKFKFEKWGLMPNIIDIDGKEYNHLYYGLKVH